MKRSSSVMCGVCLWLAFIGWIVLAPTWAAPGTTQLASYHRTQGVRAIDGDTIEADIELGWGVWLRGQSVRLLDYDAWEMSKRRQSVEVTDREVAKGQAAHRDLSALLASGPVYLSPGPEARDPFGRPLAKAYVLRSGTVVVVSDYMRGRGHQRTEAAR